LKQTEQGRILSWIKLVEHTGIGRGDWGKSQESIAQVTGFWVKVCARDHRNES